MSHSGPKPATKRVKLIDAPKPKKKAKKRRKPADPAWHPSSRGRAWHGSITKLIGTSSSPSAHATLITDRTVDNVEGSESHSDDIQLSSPDRGALSKRVTIKGKKTPLRQARSVHSHLGRMAIFLEEGKVDADDLVLPQVNANIIDAIAALLQLPSSDITSVTNGEVTRRSLKRVSDTKRKNGGKRKPSNREVSQNVSANTVAQALDLPSDFQWWHLLGHGLIGDRAQFFGNFILGRKYHNAIMNDVAESVVSQILKAMDAEREKDPSLPQAKLFISAHARFEPGYERVRLANRVTFVIKDGIDDDYKRIVKFNFYPLRKETLCETEIAEFKKLLVSLFLRGPKKAALNTPTKVKRPSDLLSPTPKKRKKSSDKQQGENRTENQSDYDRLGSPYKPLVFSKDASTPTRQAGNGVAARRFPQDYPSLADYSPRGLFSGLSTVNDEEVTETDLDSRYPATPKPYKA